MPSIVSVNMFKCPKFARAGEDVGKWIVEVELPDAELIFGKVGRHFLRSQGGSCDKNDIAFVTLRVARPRWHILISISPYGQAGS